MKKSVPITRELHDSARGFALVICLALMMLLAVIAVGLLSLGTISQRAGSQQQALSIARANARMALILAIGNLQSELGPDTRVSADSSVLDANPDTETPDQLDQSHWLGAWQSWGGWLNSEAKNAAGSTIRIAATYNQARAPMFRKWLVSQPGNTALGLDAPKTATAAPITIVGTGSVTDPQDQVKVPSVALSSGGKTIGQYAWWIGGQNQKALVESGGKPVPALAAAEAEQSSGDFGSRGISSLNGFNNLPSDRNELKKIIDSPQLALAGVPAVDARKAFHALTTVADGVIADVRWGGLKKDLNLLFEQSSLPAPYARTADIAPGPRPLSADLTTFSPKTPTRAFSSFELMREFYNVHRAAVSPKPLTWTGSTPSTSEFLGNTANGNGSGGNTNPDQTGFRRLPVIAKYYTIYSLRSRRATVTDTSVNEYAGQYYHEMVLTTALVLWNPYNMPLDLPSGQYKYMISTLPYKILPTQYRGYDNGVATNNWTTLEKNASSDRLGYGQDWGSTILPDGAPIRFEPGQFRIFSKRGPSRTGITTDDDRKLFPGYDPNPDSGRRIRIFGHKDAASNRWGIALRLVPAWGPGGVADASNAWWCGGNPGAFNTLVTLNDTADSNWPYRSNVPWRTQGICYDWTAADHDYALLAPEPPSPDLVTFQPSATDPIPFAAVGVTLKTCSLPDYNTVTGMPDYRSKNWLQGLNSLPMVKMNVSYTNATLRDLQRLDSPYQLHFRRLNGAADLASLLSRDVTNTISHLGSGSDGEKIYSAPTQELPTAPVTSLAGFAGMPLRPGWYKVPVVAPDGNNPPKGEIRGSALSRNMDNVAGYNAGVPGVGIGNSFAQPMIPGDKVYQYHDVSKNNPAVPYGSGGTASDALALSDYWDHALLVNDGLWDTWFTSTFATTTRPTQTAGKSATDLVTEFYKDGKPLPAAHYAAYTGGRATTAVIADLNAANGYLKAAAHLLNHSAFNVNSTSVDAWHALFTGLREHACAYRDKNGQLKLITPPQDKVAVSRFMTSPGNTETTDPRSGSDYGTGPSWTGVRFLTDAQLKKLAEQCVRQVKLRGPFLNMSDFINRRLATDDTGRSGMLQAAIDYDDNSRDTSSINAMYKAPADMLDSTGIRASYPYSAAARGSRFTAAPGYVVQSDLLRPLGNSLTVRDDTFLIRAYGESRDKSGVVIGRAWCEATVQRLPEYLDPSNAAETPALDPSTAAAATPTNLKTINTKFGRKIQVVSFRWLHDSEV